MRTCAFVVCTAIGSCVQPPPAWSGEVLEGFRWVDRTKDAQLWLRIQSAFAKELKPDAKGGDDSARRFKKKFIQRIVLYSSSALVLIGQREEPSAQQATLFEAYNYNLTGEQKSKIAGEDSESLWQLRILKQAKFEDSTVPDIVFSFKDCWECESVTLLGSFLYNSKDAAWSLRPWGLAESKDRQPYLEIAADIDTGTIKNIDVLIISKCAYRIADFNGDGLDDIADWCRISYERMDPPQEEISMEDRLILFTRKGGSRGLKEVAEKEESLRIRKAICAVQPKKAPCSTLPH
jgi:hypothetical protein